MDNILVLYMLEKATNSTDYLTNVHYCRVLYIRSLMWSQATTKYKIHGILKIEKRWLMWQRCDGVKADAVEVIGLMKMDCRLWNRTIFFTFLSFFSWYFIYFSFRITNMTLSIPKLSDFHIIFQILYNLNSQSIWKIGQSSYPMNTSSNKTHYIIYQCTCQKSSIF